MTREAAIEILDGLILSDEFADFPFDFRLRRLVDFGGLTRLDQCHI